MKATIGPIRLYWKRGLGQLGIWDWELVRIHTRPVRGPCIETPDGLRLSKNIGRAISFTVYHRRGGGYASLDLTVAP